MIFNVIVFVLPPKMCVDRARVEFKLKFNNRIENETRRRITKINGIVEFIIWKYKTRRITITTFGDLFSILIFSLTMSECLFFSFYFGIDINFMDKIKQKPHSLRLFTLRLCDSFNSKSFQLPTAQYAIVILHAGLPFWFHELFFFSFAFFVSHRSLLISIFLPFLYYIYRFKGYLYFLYKNGGLINWSIIALKLMWWDLCVYIYT